MNHKSVLIYLKSKATTFNPLLEIFYSQLKLSSSYWYICASVQVSPIETLKASSTVKEILEFTKQCYKKESGVFCENIYHAKGTQQSILSGLQLLSLYTYINKNQADPKNYIDNSLFPWFNPCFTYSHILTLYNPEGFFYSTEFHEKDTRFTYCALLSLFLMGKLNLFLSSENRRERIKTYLLSLQNFDGGFGTEFGAESHSGQIFCVLGSFSLLDGLESKNDEEKKFKFIETMGEESFKKLVFWLQNRQEKVNGSIAALGVNGRPCKKVDNCYAWWVGASLDMLGCLEGQGIFDADSLARWLESCQNEDGGFPEKEGVVAIFSIHFSLWHFLELEKIRSPRVSAQR